MQRIAIIGHLSSGIDVCNQENKTLLRFQVAVKDREIDLYTGEVKEETQHFEAVYWTNQTKIANQLKEGSKIYAEGKVKPDAYICNMTKEVTIQLGFIIQKLEIFSD